MIDTGRGERRERRGRHEKRKEGEIRGEEGGRDTGRKGRGKKDNEGNREINKILSLSFSPLLFLPLVFVFPPPLVVQLFFSFILLFP